MLASSRLTVLPTSWRVAGCRFFDPGGSTGPRGLHGLQRQAGLNGQNGVSVESQQLAPGNGNCPNGGAEFTAFDGTTYACTGGTGPIWGRPTYRRHRRCGPSFASNFTLNYNGEGADSCSVTTDESGNITAISCSGP